MNGIVDNKGCAMTFVHTKFSFSKDNLVTCINLDKENFQLKVHFHVEGKIEKVSRGNQGES